mmetsp:Transcript_31272/g.38670  ORF Transcript_31272/g.38670 Transcript_31272/m.38670 type:complete len:171 (+) Transcript_31272:846-1358(+)
MEEEALLVMSEPTMIEVLADARYRKSTLIGLAFAVMYSLSGYSSASFTIIELVKEDNDGLSMQYLSNGIQAFALLATPLIANAVSVKKILLAGCVVNAIGLIVMAVSEDTRLAGALILLFSFQMSMGTFYFVYLSEVAQTAAITWSFALMYLIMMAFQLAHIADTDKNLI